MTDQMPKTIERLQLEHRNMTRLLHLLSDEMESYRAGGHPDFDLLGSVMEYILHYPDLFHHPTENMIFQKMLGRDPAAQSRVGDLPKEHAQLADLTRRLAAALRNVSSDVEVPRSWLQGIVESYLSSSYQHMSDEESTFFPLAVATLREEDWDEIDAALTVKEDPLFGGKLVEEYRALHDRIMRSVV